MWLQIKTNKPNGLTMDSTGIPKEGAKDASQYPEPLPKLTKRKMYLTPIRAGNSP